MHSHRLRWLVLAWIAVVPSFAIAQDRQEVTLGSGDRPVTVFADRIESLEREQLMIAEGRVEIEQKETRLEADRVEVNTETSEAVATGHVVFFDGRDRLVGQRLEYNFRTGTGIVYQAQGSAEPHFFFGGEQMERFGEKAYRLTHGTFTTCECEEGQTPAWSVKWGKATAYLDDYIWGTSASFWVWKLPVVPFIPIFGASLRRDRQTGFLIPSFGDSSTKGFFVRQPFFWAITDSQDLLLTPTYYAKRGFGLGADYRYVRTEDSKGEISGFVLDDTQKKEVRGIVGLHHAEQITPRLTLKADLAHVSDNDYLAEFGDTLDQRSSQRLESNLSLTQRWEKWNFVGRLFTYQDLTTTQPIELQRLPELTLAAFQQPVLGNSGILFDLQSSYDNFVRQVGSAGQRIDLRPRLSYPFTPGGLFTLTPRLGFRETLYDTKVIGTKVDQGVLVENTEKSFVARSLFETGVDLEARASRVFEVGGALGIQRLQHVIEPRISYDFSTGDSPNNLPQWDGIDVIQPINTLTYSLTNRLKARAVSEDGREGRVWELARLTFSQTYTFEPLTIQPTALGQPVATTTSNRLSNLLADLIVEPVYGIRVRGTATFDPYERQVSSATTDASYEAQNWSVSFGTVHGQNGALQFIRGAAQAKLGSRWAARFSTDYDIASGTAIENRIEVDFREQCWGVTAAYINRATENEFRVTVNLLELGQYGFGRSFAGFQ